MVCLMRNPRMIEKTYNLDSSIKCKRVIVEKIPLQVLGSHRLLAYSLDKPSAGCSESTVLDLIQRKLSRKPTSIKIEPLK